ncbi:hypothetical protein AGR8A_pAt20016 [Agrobacterium fabrum str. J-07]|nr:hypothetical protein AGR8A_pAt20016 [Agrobacterium fabrum str. J-07]
MRPKDLDKANTVNTIVCSPRVLLLDDTTSALDPQTENALSTALAARQNRTMVSIPHRLSTVRHADRIVVLKRDTSWNRQFCRSTSNDEAIFIIRSIPPAVIGKTQAVREHGTTEDRDSSL